MKDFFTELNAVENVNASLFFSDEGDLVIYEVNDVAGLDKKKIQDYSSSLDWKSIRKKFNEISEAELLFSKYRVYMRRAKTGFVVVLMGLMAPIEVVRLNVDLIIPELETIKKTKGIGRFFKFRS